MEKIMKDTIEFTGIEIGKRKMIDSLMADWRGQVKCKKCFCSDGFFPGYYKQEIKMLFIARETRNCDYNDCIKQYIEYYGDRTDHDKKAFTRRMFYIVQGVRSGGTLKFKDLRTANDFIATIHANNYGFAFMNISKYSNNAEVYKADKKLINKFLEDSNLKKRNYFREELEILQPDIIITLNLFGGIVKDEYLKLCFENAKKLKADKKVTLWEMELNQKKIKILDLFHFSALNKRDKEYFYDPTIKYLFE
jgi:hypothetical protein